MPSAPEAWRTKRGQGGAVENKLLRPGSGLSSRGEENGLWQGRRQPGKPKGDFQTTAPRPGTVTALLSAAGRRGQVQGYGETPTHLQGTTCRGGWVRGDGRAHRRQQVKAALWGQFRGAAASAGERGFPGCPPHLYSGARRSRGAVFLQEGGSWRAGSEAQERLPRPGRQGEAQGSAPARSRWAPPRDRKSVV